MSFEERKQYREILERTILESADANPQAVKRFLKSKVQPETVKRLLTWPSYYMSAIVNLTAEYIAFMKTQVIIPLNKIDLDYSGYGDDLGIRGEHTFYPVAPNQGPFLDLLRHDEGEGLRVIHAITNHGIEAWRLQDGQGGKPIMIQVGKKKQQFWGDEFVYRWFRTYARPNAVACALSALELWVEEQIALGRESTKLFHTVLEGARSVAVPGLLMGIAMVNPLQHLESVLPLITTPRLWPLDIRRHLRDRTNGHLINFHRDTRFYSVLQRREERAQRHLYYRNLFPFYLLAFQYESEHEIVDGVGHRFVKAIRALTVKDMVERNSELLDVRRVKEHHESLARHRDMADPERLLLEDREDGVLIGVNLPELEAEQRELEASAPAQYQARAMKLKTWAGKGFQDNQIDPAMSVEEALEEARILSTTDFPEPHESGPYSDPTFMQMLAPNGIVGVAALAVQHMGGKLDSDDLGWCRTILLAATRDAKPRDEGWYTGIGGVGTYAARGLAALAGIDPSDNKVVRALFGLLPSLSKWTWAEVFIGLKNSWVTQPNLCWTTLSLIIDLAMVRWYRSDDDALWKRTWSIVDEATDKVVSGDPIVIPEIPLGSWLWTERVGAALMLIPVSEVMSSKEPDRTRLLDFYRSLLAWTLNEEVLHDEERQSRNHSYGGYEHQHYHWNHPFSTFVARLALELNEGDYLGKILEPLIDVWPRYDDPLTSFMGSFLNENLYWKEEPSERVWSHWRTTCEAVLNHPVLSKWQAADRNRDIPHSAQGVIGAVLLRHHGNWLKRDWMHGAKIEDLVSQWAEKVGGTPTGFGYLVRFLDGPGWSLGAEQALRWLTMCVEQAGGLARLLNEKKIDFPLSTLLWRLWSERRKEINVSGESLRQLSDLADGLVEEGNVLGGLLQRALERRDLGSESGVT